MIMNVSNNELVSLADVLAQALEARALADESINLDDESTVMNMLLHAPIDQEDPKVRALTTRLAMRLERRFSSCACFLHRAILS